MSILNLEVKIKTLLEFEIILVLTNRNNSMVHSGCQEQAEKYIIHTI